MIRITIESNNVFNTYIATGFIMMILFHVFENIGAAIGVLPLTGIPLPFISKGGSSLMSNLIGVGLVLSMSYQNSLAKERRIDKDLSRSSWNKYWIWNRSWKLVFQDFFGLKKRWEKHGKMAWNRER